MNTETNKQIVVRFNRECLQEGRPESFEELLSETVVNHSAPAGRPNGKESFYHFINSVLRIGFPDLKVEILEQVAERDLVTTRKRILATHTGEIFGIPPTNKTVEIKVIDIIRLENGRYQEHWGQSNFEEVLKSLTEK